MDIRQAADQLNQETLELAERLRCQRVGRLILDLSELDAETLSDIAAIAAQVCGVPLATVTLVDDVNQTHVGSHGVRDSLLCVSRSDGLCNVTIQTPDQNTVIYDASIDERVRGLPFVNGSYDYIKFYAGLPLVSGDGMVLGTICVLDHMPRRLRQDQMTTLERLRKLVVRILTT